MAQQSTKIPVFLTDGQKNIINSPIENKLIYKINGFSYVNHQVLVDLLNKTFDYAWNWVIIDKGINETYKFKKSKYNNTSSDDEYKSYYSWVLGELSYPSITEDKKIIWIKKQAFGGKPLIGDAKIQSQNFKSASSDALKKAASLIGFARNVYMDENIYKQIMEAEEAYDSWSEDNSILFKDQLLVLEKLNKAVGEEKFTEYVKDFCTETLLYSRFGQITPSNINNFIDYLDEKKLLNDSAAVISPLESTTPQTNSTEAFFPN